MSTSRRALLTPMLVVLVALAVLPDAPIRTGRAGLRCERAVYVDGALRCDHEAPATIAAVCGPAHPQADQTVHGGDAIDHVVLCERGDAAGLSRMPPEDLAALDQPVDLNSASAAELQGLAGIGPALAERVIAARPFASVDEFLEVRGIGPRTFDRLRKRLVTRPNRARPP